MTEKSIALLEIPILTLRGQRVILDSDLAKLYGVKGNDVSHSHYDRREASLSGFGRGI